MCVTNIYLDRYPDGHIVEFRQTSICQYGSKGRPCPTLSTIENPLRKINWGEASTELMLTRPIPQPRQRPQSPHRSPASHNRHSSEESGHRRRHSKPLLSPLRPTRQHKKERIVLVDAPPTPRTPPQKFNQTFTAPSSPASPAYRAAEHDRGRPVIVDERPLRRIPSIGAVIAPRQNRSPSRNRPVIWDSPSNSHTSFNSRLRREEEEREREREVQRIRQHEIERVRQHEIEEEAERKRRREAFIRKQDEDIRRRPAVPLAPMLPRRGTYTRPVTVVDQGDELPVMMGGLSIGESGRGRMRREQDEQEAMKQRLRERQLPKRRASVGPGYRRHRVAYDDGMYRWE
ncbi:hypothetical protein LOCC1_G002877 [Lachnellula occidentalis]|uniref:Uncharacterized protein n=1 Tax=Lachnellula occidentalis TaxID=215460 RepID=A0A8H8UGC1_9HELO|nr:hypothetical protein LOCC1_G002877 [Lachnellula occidentalis]